MARIPKRYQDKAWQTFKDWCLVKGLKAVPAHHWTLAAYALALEGQEKPDEIRKIIVAIAKAHLEKSRARPERHPLIERTLKMIDLRQDSQKQSSRLFDDNLITETTSRKTAKPKKKKPKTAPAGNKKQLSMSATPKLVSRRKLKK